MVDLMMSLTSRHSYKNAVSSKSFLCSCKALVWMFFTWIHPAMGIQIFCYVVFCVLVASKSRGYLNIITLAFLIQVSPEFSYSLFHFVFLNIDHTDAGVTQSPRHEVTEKGQTVTLTCKPVSGHNDLYWYRQTKAQGLELLRYFRSKSLMEDNKTGEDRFTAEMLKSSVSTLKIQPTEPQDSAVYLCASSLATELHKDALAVQKPWVPLSLQPLSLLSEVFCAPSY